MQHPTTLQTNTAPVDYRFLPQILKHQLKIFGNSCEEILLTIETQQSKKTRWRSNQWDENLQNDHIRISAFLKECLVHI